MVMETRAGERAGLTTKGTADKIAGLLEALGLPTYDDAPIGELVSAAMIDKKNMSGTISLACIKDIGRGFIHKISVEDMLGYFNV